MSRPTYLNFEFDHATLLVQPEFYNVLYLVFRTIFGCSEDDQIYELRTDDKQASLTFAMQVGEAVSRPELLRTLIAIVQPTEPMETYSHVRAMLDDHRAAAHWQHIALRTPDLLAFHDHATRRGVNFVTPVLHDKREDLIQVFSGEWIFPGQPPSGLFFEFVQRNPSADLVQTVEGRQAWFRDKTFRTLYDLKQREYESGDVKPFLDAALFEQLGAIARSKKLWDFTGDDVFQAEKAMLTYGETRRAETTRQ